MISEKEGSISERQGEQTVDFGTASAQLGDRKDPYGMGK